MIYFSIIISVLALLAVAVTIFIFKKGKPEHQSFLLLQNQLENLSRALDQKLFDSRQEMQSAVVSQFSESQKLIREITAQISQVQESNKQVFNIADQLQNLEKVLKNQKQRGNLGEAGLELILSNILPPTSYKLQYEFNNPDKQGNKIKVDAVIFAKDGLIPVDAKFSLDNYNRLINEQDEKRRQELEGEFKMDLKKRIDETAKYILPEEGTLPFALMFIPAEGIYYDLLVNEVGSIKVNTRSLIDYAYKERKVIIVSPTTFAAYLQSILYGFKAFKIEESAKEIYKRVEDLSIHLKKFEEFVNRLGNHLGTAVSSYNSAAKEFKKIDKDVLKITGQNSGFEVLELEKPQE